MKISTKGRYALRMMLDIAANDKNGPVCIKDIARRQSISNKYLEQLVSGLQKAGYLTSSRGAQGGYRLSRPPAGITVGMILRTTEGSLAPVACIDDSDACNRQCRCTAFRLWEKIDAAVNNVVDNTTLADLLSWQTEPQTK